MYACHTMQHKYLHGFIVIEKTLRFENIWCLIILVQTLKQIEKDEIMRQKC